MALERSIPSYHTFPTLIMVALHEVGYPWTALGIQVLHSGNHLRSRKLRFSSDFRSVTFCIPFSRHEQGSPCRMKTEI